MTENTFGTKLTCFQVKELHCRWINHILIEVQGDAILILTWKIETSAPKFVEPITKDCKPPKQQKVLR